MVLEEAGGALSEPQHRYVTAILGNISKLVTMVQELQNFPGNDAFEFEVVRLKDLLKEAVAALHTSALEGKIRLAERLSDDPLSTIGDRQKLSQAMYEFLAATIKFASPGGVVEVSAREENEKIVVEFLAASAPGTREGMALPDLGKGCQLWRLHGGHIAISQTDGCFITCELPIVRLPEC